MGAAARPFPRAKTRPRLSHNMSSLRPRRETARRWCRMPITSPCPSRRMMFSARLNLPLTRSCHDSKLPTCSDVICSNETVPEYMSPNARSKSEAGGGVLARGVPEGGHELLPAHDREAAGGHSDSPRACARAETASETRIGVRGPAGVGRQHHGVWPAAAVHVAEHDERCGDAKLGLHGAPQAAPPPTGPGREPVGRREDRQQLATHQRAPREVAEEHPHLVAGRRAAVRDVQQAQPDAPHAPATEPNAALRLVKHQAGERCLCTGPLEPLAGQARSVQRVAHPLPRLQGLGVVEPDHGSTVD
eukprot:2811615-Pyramimonas_sp.AAC.2